MNVLATYPSSKGDKDYHICEGGDGVIYCTCWAWKKNRYCKHLAMYHGKVANPVHKDIDQEVENIIKELTR